VLKLIKYELGTEVADEEIAKLYLVKESFMVNGTT